MSVAELLSHGCQRLPFSVSERTFATLSEEVAQLLASDTLLNTACLTDLQHFRHQAHRRKWFELLLDRATSCWLQKWFGQGIYFHHLRIIDDTAHHGAGHHHWPLSQAQWQDVTQKHQFLTLRLVLQDGVIKRGESLQLPVAAGQCWLVNAAQDWHSCGGRFVDVQLALSPSVLDGLIAIEGLPSEKDLLYLSAPMLYRRSWSAWHAASPC